MKTFICAVAVTFIAFAGGQSAFADAETGQGYFSVMGSYMDDDDDRNVEDAVNGGQVSLGYAMTDNLNIEGLISFASAKGGDQELMGVGIDLQHVYRRAERFSPYLHAGLGWMEVTPAGSAPSDDSGMYSAGAGFYLDLFDSNVSLRGEYRYRMESTGGDNLKDSLISLGLQIPFGAGTPTFVDSDGDGAVSYTHLTLPTKVLVWRCRWGAGR